MVVYPTLRSIENKNKSKSKNIYEIVVANLIALQTKANENKIKLPEQIAALPGEL